MLNVVTGSNNKEDRYSQNGHQKLDSTIGSVYYVIVIVFVGRGLGQRYETYNYINVQYIYFNMYYYLKVKLLFKT